MMKSQPCTWYHLQFFLGNLMTLVGRHLMMQRRVFWLGKQILIPCWMKVVLVLLLEWEDLHWTKDQKYPWRHNLFGHPYSLHKHWLEQILSHPSQLILPLLVSWKKSTNTTSTPAAISSYPFFCLFGFLFSAFLNAYVRYQQEGAWGIGHRRKR